MIALRAISRLIEIAKRLIGIAILLRLDRPPMIERRRDASLGFSPEEAARINPGIVYVSLSAYGHAGPWSERRGFDSLVQTTTGFNHAEGEAAGPSRGVPAARRATGFPDRSGRVMNAMEVKSFRGS